MDGHIDNYGDQYVGLDLANYDPAPPRTRNMPAYYEDSLRFAQYGVSARLDCRNPNPYIQDDIEDSQRHQKPSPYTMAERIQRVGESSCEPGLSGASCGRSMGQVMTVPARGGCPMQAGMCGAGVYDESCVNRKMMPEGPMYMDNISVGAVKKDKKKKKKAGVIEIDNTMMLYIFIFIVLILMVTQYWKSLSDMKKTIASLSNSVSNSLGQS